MQINAACIVNNSLLSYFCRGMTCVERVRLASGDYSWYDRSMQINAAYNCWNIEYIHTLAGSAAVTCNSEQVNLASSTQPGVISQSPKPHHDHRRTPLFLNTGADARSVTTSAAVQCYHRTHHLDNPPIGIIFVSREFRHFCHPRGDSRFRQ